MAASMAENQLPHVRMSFAKFNTDNPYGLKIGVGHPFVFRTSRPAPYLVATLTLPVDTCKRSHNRSEFYETPNIAFVWMKEDEQIYAAEQILLIARQNEFDTIRKDIKGEKCLPPENVRGVTIFRPYITPYFLWYDLNNNPNLNPKRIRI